MGLALLEGADHEADALVLGRGQADFVGHPGEVVAPGDPLGRVDHIARSVRDVGAGAEQGVVEEGIVRVVGLGVDPAVHVGRGDDEVEVGDPALDRQGSLVPPVVPGFRKIVGDLHRTLGPVVGEDAVGLGVLAHEGGPDRPALVQVDQARDAHAPGVDLVVVVLGQGVVVDGHARGRIGARALHIVDVAAVMGVPGDEADRHAVVQGDVDQALEGVARAAVADGVHADVVGRREARRVGRVGDDLDRAGLRAGAVEGALRAREGLDPGDVIDMQVERPADGGDGLLVEVGPDAGHGAGVVAIPAGGDAAHVDRGEAGRRALVGDAGQELHIVVEALDLQLLELAGGQGRHRHRHVLDVLRPLLGRHHQLLDRGGLLRRAGGGHAGEHGGGEEHGGQTGRGRLAEHIGIQVRKGRRARISIRR